ncbi:histidine phosphatase family protein [Breoghania sp. L-A4]|uniref:SixA phosphatase family protein n=1 Tax=Breoghania sp. L-A4 TaxID=2304600 RepID=UPI000E35A0D5|nr:histidine phosphatase family protein [Breoghania sp. L-A4]AXS41230.1 histidine phosphatase family protein [Breoghania sp. L-A4]
MQHRRLFLVRHAKSASNDEPGADFNRALSGRGRRACRLMGDYMNAHALLPETILCSAAQRTRETLAHFLAVFSHDHRILLTHALYDAPHRDCYEIIRKHGGAAKTLMLIGHNPSIQEMALDLTKDGDPALIAAIVTKYPTAALTVLDLDIESWSDVAPRTARLQSFITPRDIDQTPTSHDED